MPRKTKDVDVKQATSKVQKSNKEEIKSKKVEEVKKSTKKIAEKKAPLKKDNDKKSTAKKDSTTKQLAVKKDTTTKKSTTKKVSEKKDNTTKKETVKKDTTTKKSIAKKAELSAVSNNVPKKSKETNLSSKAKKDIKRETVKTKKSTEVSKSDKKTKSTNSTKIAKPKQSTTTSSKKTSKQSNVVFSPEYYDLPFKYNQTVVKILAQTPTNLFIYWEISDEDRENLKNKYGQYFFEITKPVLIVHNITFNYSFEIDIDDFANSWYLHVNDSNSEYKVELGRRPIPVNYNYISNYDIEKNGPINELQIPYVYISSSNELDTPNDKILFNKISKLYFRNVKTNDIVEKDISDFSSIYKDGIFINIYKLYQELYKEEIKNDSFNLYNPSSGNISSGSFSSRFY